MVIQLIAKDKNEKFQFQGKCKLLIDSLSKMLLVEPYDEEYKMISAIFKWEFVARKNILCVFAECNFQDFALIFENSEKCNKAMGFLFKKGATVGNKGLINQRFLPLLFNEISGNNESNLKMKELFLKWIKFFDGKEKEEYIQILKDYNYYDLFFSNMVGDLQKNPRKRKAKNITKRKESKMDSTSNRLNNKNYKKGCSDKQQNLHVLSKIIEEPNFEILKYVQNGHSKIKLSVFPSSDDQKYCFEYFWQKSMSCYICCTCNYNGKNLTAKIIKRNGKDVVQLNETQHVCKLQEHKTIIEKPNYEVLFYEYGGSVSKRIIVFLDSSRMFCYEYRCISKLYLCCGCKSKRHYVRADIYQKEDGTEFILSKSSNHVCEPRKYIPGKYGMKEIVKAPNFKVFNDLQNGIDKSKLVIFTSSDQSKCYEYYWKNHNKKFLCNRCQKKMRHVTAELFQNGDGNSYLKLSNKKHVCEPCEYDPDKFDPSKKEIIESSNFKIFKYKHNGIQASKLIIFCETNKNLCYEYFWNKKAQLFYCSYCLSLKSHVTATVFKNDKGNENLILSKAQHVCNLLEFNVEKYKDDVIVKKEMYEIASSSLERTKNKILIIFANEEKRFYFKFLNCYRKKYYYCSKCFSSSKIYITATIQNEEKENECVFMSNEKHICEPFEYFTINEKNIIMAPNFQFIKRKLNEKIHQHLVVFPNDEKSECYEYAWKEREKYFICYTCQNHHRISVYAKIFKNDTNEECIELCEKQHKCKPIKFVPENINAKIVKQPDFKLYETVYGQKNCKRLAIFDSKNRKMGNIYSYSEKRKKFFCCRCRNKKTNVTAKVLQDENGENYLELNDNEHVCKMQKI